jgi:hypothetical protein
VVSVRIVLASIWPLTRPAPSYSVRVSETKTGLAGDTLLAIVEPCGTSTVINALLCRDVRKTRPRESYSV